MPRSTVVTNLKLINQAMKDKGVDDTWLAKNAGIHISLVRRYLRGQVDIGGKNAPRIARALGLDPGDVMWGRAA